MSMDFGASGVSSDYQIKARLRAAIDDSGLTFAQICRAADLRPDEIARAFDQGIEAHPGNIHIVERLSAALGRDAGWAMTGESSSGQAFRSNLTEEVVRLVWEFIYKRRVPLDHRQALVDHVKEMINKLQVCTRQAATRAGIPRTWKDVAWIYERLRAERGAKE